MSTQVAMSAVAVGSLDMLLTISVTRRGQVRATPRWLDVDGKVRRSWPVPGTWPELPTLREYVLLTAGSVILGHGPHPPKAMPNGGGVVVLNGEHTPYAVLHQQKKWLSTSRVQKDHPVIWCSGAATGFLGQAVHDFHALRSETVTGAWTIQIIGRLLYDCLRFKVP